VKINEGRNGGGKEGIGELRKEVRGLENEKLKKSSLDVRATNGIDSKIRLGPITKEEDILNRLLVVKLEVVGIDGKLVR